MFFSKLFKRDVKKDISLCGQPIMTTQGEISDSSLEKENKRKVALRKGELGEYKIDIQLVLCPLCQDKDFQFVSEPDNPN